jgi:hypothetical protein
LQPDHVDLTVSATNHATTANDTANSLA